MKKMILPFAAVALIAASCGKDYACMCSVNGVSDAANYRVYKKVTKKWMKDNDYCVSDTYTDYQWDSNTGQQTAVQTTRECTIEKK
jgi:hypothetical protein